MVQLVRDEMEAQGLVDPAEKEGKLTHEHKEVKLLDLDYSDFSDDEEEEGMQYCNKANWKCFILPIIL